MKLLPLSDYCFIKKIQEDDISKGGIIIPDNAKAMPEKGIVKAIGRGEFLENGTIRPMEVSVGQTVLYNKYAGNEVKVYDDEHLIIREADILAIIQEN